MRILDSESPRQMQSSLLENADTVRRVDGERASPFHSTRYQLLKAQVKSCGARRIAASCSVTTCNRLASGAVLQRLSRTPPRLASGRSSCSQGWPEKRPVKRCRMCASGRLVRVPGGDSSVTSHSAGSMIRSLNRPSRASTTSRAYRCTPVMAWERNRPLMKTAFGDDIMGRSAGEGL